jgi:hypothetical protein
MTTTFINPNNPLRRQAPAAQATQQPHAQAQRQGMQRQASAQPQRQQVAPGKQSGATTTPVGIPTPQIQKFASNEHEQNFEAQGQGGVYNPRRFAGYVDQNGIRRAVASQTERMYDSQGEMNAWDKKDALNQAAYLLNHVARQSPLAKMQRQASVAEKDERRKILAAAINDPTGEGFALVGQELALPIKAIIDYEGFIRKILRVRTLAQGELFRIAKDVRATAYVVGQDGQSIESRAYGTYILPDESLITSFPEVALQELYQINFDVLDRMQDTARQEIELEEDKRGIRMLDRMSQNINSVSTFSTMSLSVLENLRFQVERHRLIVDKFLINRQELSDIQINMSGSVDPVTQREWNLAGYVGRWLGAHILTAAGTGVEEVIQAGTLYAVTAPEYIGEMGIRIELFSEPYNLLPLRQAAKGFAFIEQVGFGGPNSRAVAKAVKG